MIWFLALIWPFGALVYSAKNIKSRNFVIASLAMAVMLGMSIDVVESENYSADITRFLSHAANYKYIPWAWIFMEKDFFLGLSGKLLSQISDNLTFLAICYYVMYIILFLLCFKIIIKNYSKYYGKRSLFYIAGLFLVVPFTFFNSLRFALATYYFVWCMLEIFFNNKKKFYGLILLSPIFHFSFLMLIPLPFLHLFLKNKLRLVWIIYALSIVFSTSSTSYFLHKFAEHNFRGSISESVEIYASEVGLESMSNSYKEQAAYGNFNRTITRTIVDIRNYGIMICVVLLSIAQYKHNKHERRSISYFTLILLLMSLANVAASASNGERFYHITSMVSIYFLFAYLYEDRKKIRSFYSKNKCFFMILFSLGILYGIIYIFVSRNAYSYVQLVFGNICTSILF